MKTLVWTLLAIFATSGTALADSTSAPKVERSSLRVSEAGSQHGGLEIVGVADLHAQLKHENSLRLNEFPVAPNMQIDLRLHRFRVTDSDTRHVVMNGFEERTVAPPDIALFKGTVEGRPDSRVFLAISPRSLHAWIEDGKEGFIVAPAPSIPGQINDVSHFAHRRSVLQRTLLPVEEKCGVDIGQVPAFIPADLDQQVKRAVFRNCRVALDTDFEYFQQFNDVEAALCNAYAVMGAISAFYERDLSVQLIMPFLRIWTTNNDPYSYVGGADTGLVELRNYWIANHNSGSQFVERDLAHLMSGRPVGAYGNVGVLCDYNSGFSIAGGNGLNFLHDVVFVGHEIGHNFNGIHTHCFNPPVDQCATGPGCNSTQDCSTAPGTIMSYCDNCPGGLSNIILGFAAENVARIRTEIDSSCLVPTRNPIYVDWRNSGFEDGTLAQPYDSVAEGVWFVHPSGNVIIASGTYGEAMIVFQPMTLSATGGSAVIGTP